MTGSVAIAECNLETWGCARARIVLICIGCGVVRALCGFHGLGMGLLSLSIKLWSPGCGKSSGGGGGGMAETRG